MPTNNPYGGPQIVAVQTTKPKMKQKFKAPPRYPGRSKNAHKSYLDAYSRMLTSNGKKVPKELEDAKYYAVLTALHNGDISLETIEPALTKGFIKCGKLSDFFGRSFEATYSGYIFIESREALNSGKFTYYWGPDKQFQYLNGAVGHEWMGANHYNAYPSDAKCCVWVEKLDDLPYNMKLWPEGLSKAFFVERYIKSTNCSGYGHHAYQAGPSFPPDKTLQAIHKGADMKAWRSINIEPSNKQLKRNVEKFIEYQKKAGNMPAAEEIEADGWVDPVIDPAEFAQHHDDFEPAGLHNQPPPAPNPGALFNPAQWGAQVHQHEIYGHAVATPAPAHVVYAEDPLIVAPMQPDINEAVAALQKIAAQDGGPELLAKLASELDEEESYEDYFDEDDDEDDDDEDSEESDDEE